MGSFQWSNLQKFVSKAKLQPNSKHQRKCPITFERYKIDENFQQTTYIKPTPRNRLATFEFVCATTQRPKFFLPKPFFRLYNNGRFWYFVFGYIVIWVTSNFLRTLLPADKLFAIAARMLKFGSIFSYRYKRYWVPVNITPCWYYHTSTYKLITTSGFRSAMLDFWLPLTSCTDGNITNEFSDPENMGTAVGILLLHVIEPEISWE